MYLSIFLLRDVIDSFHSLFVLIRFKYRIKLFLAASIETENFHENEFLFFKKNW